MPYWQSGDFLSHKKFMAMEHSKLNNTDLKFICFDHVFEHYDWTINPSKSYKQLLRDRAQQLRDTYKYLILSYSGGHDSQTMLNAFVDNNIFIDEIYIQRYFSKHNSLGNREQTYGAIPYMNHIRYKIPNTKVTIHDNSMDHNYYNYYIMLDEFKNRNSFEPMLVEQYYHTFEDKDIRKSFDKNNFCNIKGVDKPRLMKKDNHYHCYFVDNQLKGLLVPESRIEFFYITPDMPELHIKQCHIIKNILNTEYSNVTDLEPLFHPKHEFRHKINDYLRDKIWHPFSLEAMGKPDIHIKSSMLNPKIIDDWNGIRLNDENLYKRILQLRIDINENYGSMFNDGDVLNDYKGFISRTYDLGT